MAASKPKILISQLLGKIETKCRRLYLHFRGPAVEWDRFKYCSTKPEVKNPIWKPPNRKYVYLRFQIILWPQFYTDCTVPYGVRFIIISRIVCWRPRAFNALSANTGGRKLKCILSKQIAGTCDFKKNRWIYIIFSIWTHVNSVHLKVHKLDIWTSSERFTAWTLF